LELLEQVLASPQWGGFHDIVGQFEREFAAFQHCRFGVSACNGTVTLEMALEVAGIRPGDEVIVPAVSFISTATSVSRLGATPVFVDIEPFTFNMDPDCAARAVSRKTKALIAVHFGGPMADMDRLAALCRDRGLVLIEDAAHSQGAEWCGQRAGSFGLCGSFSFQNGKVMTSGEGGALTTNDEEFAVKLRALANQGRRAGENFFFHYTLGSNYRLTALQAAVLVAQLERLPEQIETRRRNEALLKRELSGIAGLRWQEPPPQAARHSHYLLLGRIDAARLGRTRDEFHTAISAEGVPCTPFYPHPLYGNPLYRQGSCRVEPCPVTEACVRDAFWFPHRLLMGDEEFTRQLAGVVRRALGC
jgi:dTDP-4-amino-4,6-dideoxygalactose transaminase